MSKREPTKEESDKAYEELLERREPCSYCGLKLEPLHNMQCYCSVDNSYGYHIELDVTTNKFKYIANTKEWADKRWKK